jgi:hypothetical protein
MGKGNLGLRHIHATRLGNALRYPGNKGQQEQEDAKQHQ